jgi:hypothetical protein
MGRRSALNDIDLDPMARTPGEERSLVDRFLEFDRDNPSIWKAFKKLAIDLLQRGFQRYSADAIFHAMRYSYDLEHGPGGQLRVNDHYVRLYSEKLAEIDPRFRTFFRFMNKRK